MAKHRKLYIAPKPLPSGRALTLPRKHKVRSRCAFLRLERKFILRVRPSGCGAGNFG